MAVTEYIGARYVPLFADPITWSSDNYYEPLTIVAYQGNSYTSKQYVPSGIDITNTEFWALTGNYNAQIEGYRKEVSGYSGRITTVEETVSGFEGRVSTLENLLNNVIISSTEINPAELYGGTWEYITNSHLFLGFYIYKRVS